MDLNMHFTSLIKNGSKEFPGDPVVKILRFYLQGPGFNPWVRKIPWRRKWQPTPVLLPGKSHRQKSVAGFSPRGRKRAGQHQKRIALFLCQANRNTQSSCLEKLGVSIPEDLMKCFIVSSVSQFSRSVVFDSLRPHGLQHTRLPWCPPPTPRACSNSCPLSQ